MASSTNLGFVNWKYNDWRRMPSVDDQIFRLQRHIEEVERYAFDCQEHGRRMMLQQQMLPNLQQQLDRLEARQRMTASGANSRFGKTARYVRGSEA